MGAMLFLEQYPIIFLNNIPDPMIEGKRQISPQSFARMGWSDHKESSQPSFADRGGGKKVYNEAYTRNSAATPLDVLLRRSEYAQLQRPETVMPVPEPFNVNSSDPVSFCIYRPFVFPLQDCQRVLKDSLMKHKAPAQSGQYSVQ